MIEIKAKNNDVINLLSKKVYKDKLNLHSLEQYHEKKRYGLGKKTCEGDLIKRWLEFLRYLVDHII